MLQEDISSLEDILRILGSTRGGKWQIFRDRASDFVNTINLGKLKLKGYETLTKLRWHRYCCTIIATLKNFNILLVIKKTIIKIKQKTKTFNRKICDYSSYFLLSSETNKLIVLKDLYHLNTHWWFNAVCMFLLDRIIILNIEEAFYLFGNEINLVICTWLGQKKKKNLGTLFLELIILWFFWFFDFCLYNFRNKSKNLWNIEQGCS